MSEEERKAFEECKEFLKEKSSTYMNYYNDECNQRTFWFSNLEVVLNLIEKKQKQLELKDKIINEMQNDVYEAIKNLPETAYEMFGNNFCICDDCDDINRELECNDCMKIYYENKVKENKNNESKRFN